MKIRDTINFCIGLLLGVMGYIIYTNSRTLYYFCFCPCAISIFIIINYTFALAMEKRRDYQVEKTIERIKEYKNMINP